MRKKPRFHGLKKIVWVLSFHTSLENNLTPKPVENTPVMEQIQPLQPFSSTNALGPRQDILSAEMGSESGDARLSRRANARKAMGEDVR